MPRTQGTLYADTPHIGGYRLFAAPDLSVLSSATAPVLTRDTAGIWYYKRTSSGNETITFRCPYPTMARISEANAGQMLQEKFGNQAIGPIGVQGFPGGPLPWPQTEATALQLKPVVSPGVIKSFTVLAVEVIYGITVAAGTSGSVAIYQTQYRNNTAPSVSNLLAPVALTTAQLATQTQPYRVITPANAQISLSATDMVAEAQFVIPNTTVLAFYGMAFSFNFNFD